MQTFLSKALYIGFRWQNCDRKSVYQPINNMILKHTFSYTQCWEWGRDTSKYSRMRDVTTRDSEDWLWRMVCIFQMSKRRKVFWRGREGESPGTGDCFYYAKSGFQSSLLIRAGIYKESVSEPEPQLRSSDHLSNALSLGYPRSVMAPASFAAEKKLVRRRPTTAAHMVFLLPFLPISSSFSTYWWWSLFKLF